MAELAFTFGEPMFGSTLGSFGFGAINDAGEIAFVYSLQNGVRGIALAVPVPEPATVGLAPILGLLLRRCRRREGVVVVRPLRESLEQVGSN